MADEFILRGTDYVKAAFVAALRAAYQAQTFYPIYKYDPDDTLTGISIYESFPKRTLRVPGIYVATGSGDMSRTTLDSEDFLMEKMPVSYPTGLVAWGHVDTTVKLSILGLTDRDRRKITDLTALFCRHLFSVRFAAFGIGYRDLSIEGESEQEWQGQQLYMNSITIPCYTEFQVHYDVPLIDAISNLNLETVPEI